MTINTYIFGTFGILCVIGAIRRLEVYFNNQNDMPINGDEPIKKTTEEKPGKFGVIIFAIEQWFKFRYNLTKVFYLKFFAIRELVYVEFTYEYFKNHNMKRETHTRLAYVSRVTPVERIHKLFNHKIDGVKLKIVNARIIPLTNIPKA